MKNPLVQYFGYTFSTALLIVGVRIGFGLFGLTANASSVWTLVFAVAALWWSTRAVKEEPRRLHSLTQLATNTTVAAIACGRLTGYPLLGTVGVLLGFVYATVMLAADDDQVPVWYKIIVHSVQAGVVAHWLFRA